MKTVKLIILVIFGVLLTSQVLIAQSDPIGKIKIRSKIALNYDSRSQKKDTIYITINRWTYNPVSLTYDALIFDYIRQEHKQNAIEGQPKQPSSFSYVEIDSKVKSYTLQEIDGLFAMLKNPILITESYSNEMNKLLITGLFIDTTTNVFEDGRTVYGGSKDDWELITE